MGCFIEATCQAKKAKLETAVHTSNSIAQHVNSAIHSNLWRQTFQELQFDLCTVMRAKSFPFFGLRFQHQVRDIKGIRQTSRWKSTPTTFPLEARGVACWVQMCHAGVENCGIRTSLKQAGLNDFLEGPLRYLYGQTVSWSMTPIVRARIERADFSASHKVSHT